jgi:hypothetical protein
VGFLYREVEPGADGAGLGLKRGVLGGDGVGDEVCDERGDRLAGDFLQYGDSLKVRTGKGPTREDEDKDPGEEDGVEDGTRVDAGDDAPMGADREGTGTAEIPCEASDASAAVGKSAGFGRAGHG